MNEKMNAARRWITQPEAVPILSTGLVIVLSAVVSYHATRSMTLQTGAMGNAFVASVYPLLLEGGATVSGIHVANVSRAERSLWAKPMVFGLIAAAIVVNVVHALGSRIEMPRWVLDGIGAVLAGIAPLVLIGCIDILLHTLRRRRTTAAKAPRRAPALAAKKPVVTPTVPAESKGRPGSAGLGRPGIAKTEAQSYVEQRVAEDPTVSGADVHRELVALNLPAGDSTVRGWVKEAKARLNADADDQESDRAA